MTNIPKWQRKLTKAQLRHLAETSSAGRPSLAGLRRNLAFQRASGVPCCICSDIARRLGT